jgi:BlaI family penicillinase repressor
VKKQNIPEMELKILGILWQGQKPMLVQEVLDQWRETPPPGYTTILKKLQVMEEKGLVGYEKQGRSHAYFPQVSQKEVSQEKIHGLMDHIFGGDPLAMAAAFLGDQKISKDELGEIRKLIDQMEDDNSDSEEGKA